MPDESLNYDPNLNGELEWMMQAACVPAGLTADDFFVEAGHTLAADVKELCRTCPVRRECAQYAKRKEYAGGYFAAMSVSAREACKTPEDIDAWLDAHS